MSFTICAGVTGRTVVAYTRHVQMATIVLGLNRAGLDYTPGILTPGIVCFGLVHPGGSSCWLTVSDPPEGIAKIR